MRFSEIIGLWGRADGLGFERSAELLAADIGAKRWTVIGWLRRESIPSEYWASVLRAAANHDIPLTADDLVAAAAYRRTSAPCDARRTCAVE